MWKYSENKYYDWNTVNGMVGSWFGMETFLLTYCVNINPEDLSIDQYSLFFFCIVSALPFEKNPNREQSAINCFVAVMLAIKLILEGLGWVSCGISTALLVSGRAPLEWCISMIKKYTCG